MNNADVVAALRHEEEFWIGEGDVGLTALYGALALAIEQGGGCPACNGQGNVWVTHPGTEGWLADCGYCHGTGISPELMKLLAELGVGE